MQTQIPLTVVLNPNVGITLSPLVFGPSEPLIISTGDINDLLYLCVICGDPVS